MTGSPKPQSKMGQHFAPDSVGKLLLPTKDWSLSSVLHVMERFKDPREILQTT